MTDKYYNGSVDQVRDQVRLDATLTQGERIELVADKLFFPPIILIRPGQTVNSLLPNY